MNAEKKHDIDMPREKLLRLAIEAVPRGVTDQSLVSIISSATEIEVSRASTDSLLRIYRRRLKHTGGDKKLLTITQQLVDFLSDYPREELTWISVTGKGRHPTFLLCNPERTRILHWMRMFGARKRE
ncbi:MAG: hypothetical protein WAX14_08485 [Rhodococcus sp. (in: high G+C Gram-positive bacteria)]|uniref:hypothetical protein n=1 Tax=Rhodococcus sp. TaxID=1831 RepID=UPI003BB6114B